MPDISSQLDGKPISERQIWDWAGDLIEAHSQFAAIEASKLADAYLERGDLYGQRVLMRVVRAITAMTDSDGEAAN